MGLALILAGANFLTDGAADLAKRMRVSEFVIGVTIIGIGTSMPELVVSFVSALAGQSDMAIGNVLGSNLFNTLLILGVTTLVVPVRLTRNNLKKDIPFGILASVALFIVGSDTLLDKAPVNYIGRNEGLLLLCFFAIFMVYTVYSTQDRKRIRRAPKPVVVKRKLWLSLVMVIGGLAGLIYGGNLLVDNAVVIAQNLGVSESVIGVTLLAGGTSLPELAASLVSALKNKPDMALGNIIGSNIFNIFLVLGLSSTVAPLTAGSILPADMLVLVGVSILPLLAAYTFKKNRIDRFEGVLFILIYVAYIFWMLYR